MTIYSLSSPANLFSNCDHCCASFGTSGPLDCPCWDRASAEADVDSWRCEA